MLSVDERFWSKVEFTGFCWNWTGFKSEGGYGRVMISHTPRGAHRVAYEALVGGIPDGLHIDHLCRNRACVNPDHLEPVTQQENNRRAGVSRRGITYPHMGKYQTLRTHCPKGHEYSEANTYTYRNRRTCRTCKREQNLASYHRRKENA